MDTDEVASVTGAQGHALCLRVHSRDVLQSERDHAHTQVVRAQAAAKAAREGRAAAVAMQRRLARQIGVTQRRQVQYARKRKRHDAMAARTGEQVRTEAVRRKVDAVRREIAGAKRRLESVADADQQRRVRPCGGGDGGDGLTGGGSSAGSAGAAAAADATGILRSSGV